MRISSQKDDNLTGFHPDRRSAREIDETSTVGDHVARDQMIRTRHEPRHYLLSRP
jgi:hypothetical protein